MAKAGNKFKMVTARSWSLPFSRRAHWRTASIVLVASIIALSGAAGFGWWRLSQGPVSLSLISGQLEGLINKRLKGVSIKIRDVVLERDDKASRVHFRLRGLRLIDNSGVLLARAPRATIGFKASDFFSGNLAPTRLTLIGPNVILHRQVDGSFQLGFGAAETGNKRHALTRGDMGVVKKRDVKPAKPAASDAAVANNSSAELISFIPRSLMEGTSP